MAVTVREITMAAPDIVCVQVDDPPLTFGAIVNNVTPIGGTAVSNVTNNGSGKIRITAASSIFTVGNTGTGSPCTFTIAGVLGVTAANGSFFLTYVNGTTVDIQNSTFSGTYTGGTGTIINNTPFTSHSGNSGLIIGRGGNYIRYKDDRSTTYLNRSAALVAANYGTIGGRTVTAVYLKSQPYIDGYHTNYVACSSSTHLLFLKLNANLTQGGPYTITFPAGTGIASAAFTFSDTSTRAIALHVNQIGVRPSDALKLGYLGLWIPAYGTEGQIDIPTTYSLTAFNIIDALGSSVFSGTLSLRTAPTDAELGSGIAANNLVGGYPDVANMTMLSSTTNFQHITAITKANPCQITTANPHGWSVGQKIRLYNCGDSGSTPGLGELNNVTCKVKTVPTSTTLTITDVFDVNIDSTGYAGTYATGTMQGIVYKGTQVNRAGTYVYGADFSALTASNLVGKTAPYRLRVAGLGVSDPFEISDTASWYALAQISAAGEYSQRNGMALDSRFGFARPNAFSSSIMTIYESNLCYQFSDLSGTASGAVNTSVGAAEPWIKSTTANFGGSWMDAGDYVQRIGVGGIAGSVYMLLDIAEQVPATQQTDFNIPKSSEVLNPATYTSASDILPDTVHQAIWGLDTYRVTQKGDGSVYSGLGMDSGTGTHTFEPSYLYRGIAYVYAADHVSTFNYAGMAAKLATVLKGFGLTTLSSMWLTSAQSAFTWANALYTGSDTDRNNYYNGTLNSQTNAGWSAGTYTSNITTLQGLCVAAQTFAAGCLFRATDGAAPYAAILNARYNDDFTGNQGYGLWEYTLSAFADSAKKAQIYLNAIYRANTYIVAYNEGDISYRNLRFFDLTPFYFGTDGTSIEDNVMNLIHAYAASTNPTEKTKYLKTLQAGLAFICGANQSGQSTTQGVGPRPMMNFHPDAKAMGVDCPDGVGCYGFSFLGGGGSAFLNFGTGPINWIVENPNIAYASEFEYERTEAPESRYCFPMLDAIFNTSFVLGQRERTIQETMIPLQTAALFLAGWDGNTPSGGSEPPPSAYQVQRPRIKLR